MADMDDNLSGGIQPMFDDPSLPKGWSRDVVQRKAGGRYEVSLISPSGKVLKNRTELGAYLKEHKLKKKVEDFDFTVMGKDYVPARSSRTRALAKTPAKSEPKGKKDKVSKEPKASTKEKPSRLRVKEEAKAHSTTRRRRGEVEEKVKEEKEEKEEKRGRTRKKKAETDSQEKDNEEDTKTETKEEIKEEKFDDETGEEKSLPKRGRVKPKRYDSPDPEPAPRRAKMKAMFKDIEQEAEEEEASTPRGRGRPKKNTDVKEEVAEKSPVKGKKTGAKKAKPKKRVVDLDDPDVAKNSQILKEIEAEIREINGTSSRKRSRKRGGSGSSAAPAAPPAAETSPTAADNNNKDRPALEGFESEVVEPKRHRSESKSSDKPVESEEESAPKPVVLDEIPPELADGRRRSQRARKIDIPALLKGEESPDDEEEIFSKPTKKTKKLVSPKPQPAPQPMKFESRKRTKSARRNRRSSKAVSEDEDESIPLDSLEGAINSAASLLDDQSDSSGEQEQPIEKPPPKAARPKQSRSGRNVRSPRRPMENDFETDFSTLRRAMNATTSDFASRKRVKPVNMGMQYMDMGNMNKYESEYDPFQEYYANTNVYKRTSDTARTRTFEENTMEKTMSLMEPGLQMSAQDREPLLLETHLRAAEPPVPNFPKRQRKSSSQSDFRTPGDKSMYRKTKQGSTSRQPHGMGGDRSLLRGVKIDSMGDGEHMESMLLQKQQSRDPRELISEMTPPPTHPIIPSDDHNYSMSSRYLSESATSALNNSTDTGDESLGGASVGLGGGAEARVLSMDQHDLLQQISAQSASGVGANSAAIASTSGAALSLGAEGGVTVPISSVGVSGDGEAGATPKEIVIYVGDKPTVVPVMQDESGMSVITLPNGIAEEDIQASLQASLQAAS